MGPIFAVCLLLAIAFIFWAIQNSAPRPKPVNRSHHATVQAEPEQMRVFNANKQWLVERWEAADKDREKGDFKVFPKWFYEAATDRQLYRIRSIGLNVPSGSATKGQASDIIGLFERAEELDEQILAFFKIKIARKELNESRARHEVAKLLADAANAAAWAQRPADSMQKEFYRFFKISIPNGLTHADAEKMIASQRADLEEHNQEALDDWDYFEQIVGELLDADTREDYSIRKPSLAVIRSAVESLRHEGRSLSDLADDPGIVAEKIAQLKPELAC